MNRYRFALKPKWIFGHVLLTAMVFLMVNLGFWQLRRLDEKRNYKAELGDRAQQNARPIQSIFADGASATNVSLRRGDINFTHVTATGTYDSTHEFLIRNRSDGQGHSGYSVVTPLILNDGRAVMIERGWISLDSGNAPGTTRPIPGSVAPSGPVTVEGLTFVSEEKTGTGATKEVPIELVLNRLDLARIDNALPYSVLPASLLVPRGDNTKSSEIPYPFATPDVSEGPHLGYAIQWFAFSAMGVFGWPVLLRRTAKQLARENAAA